MCGLTGFLAPISSRHTTDYEEAIRNMSNRLIHRGPDDGGIWFDEDNGIYLGHRRLSILDLSYAGHQPMISHSGRFVIVFNGEIYNHLELRKILEKDNGTIEWRGHSDTETLLSCFENWGIEKTLKQAVGMFAFGLWDRTERLMILARDRMGEKPLYYGWNGGIFFFASELKALCGHQHFSPQINRHAVALFFRYNYIPTPYSIYLGIYKLWPGSILILKKGAEASCPWDIDSPPFGSFHARAVSLHQYWSLLDVATLGQSVSFSGSENDAANQLEKILSDAVISQQLSDVPLGALLSGGVDSSTIVALMQANAPRPIKTFTIGFTEEGFNEAVNAKALAAHLKTDHAELYISPNEAMAVIPRLPEIYDEPFSDSSQIPTFLVAQMARQYVTVALSGDAGDELFGGYYRYFWASHVWKMICWMPCHLRRILSLGMSRVPPSFWKHLYALLVRVLPNRLRITTLEDKAHKIAEIISVASQKEDIYYQLVSHWKDPAHLVIGASEHRCFTTESIKNNELVEFEHRMMYCDAMSYLLDDILVKLDRAAMAITLETRVPFLDHHVVEFAWRLPLSMKIQNRRGKWILRKILNKYVPNELVDRPKTGFAIPLDSWLRGPLRDWAESLIDHSRLKSEAILDPIPIITKWQEHIQGKRNWQYLIWDVLMFQAWYEHWG